ncbi:MAG: Spy/CpxP family protein refolding chaperone [Methylophilus sp.]|nr:Spy/CpxP family protein refolding chaperone [Methylophilus sp.]
MNTTFKTLLAAACITIAATSLAVAEHSETGDKPHYCVKGHHQNLPHAGVHGFGQPHFLHGIALTAEQEDKLFALHHAEVPKIRAQMKQRQQLNQALRELSQATPFDEAKANTIADKLATLERESAFNRARTESKVLAVLTLEQREQAIKNKAQFGKHDEMHQPTGFRGRSHQRPDIRS